MSGRDLLTDERRLFEELCTTHWLEAGFRRVKQNKGSPGVDGVTISEFETRLVEELGRLREELDSWTYQPAPVRRVEIPKPGGKGIRLLGVPTVRDRVVHATLKLILEPIFEPLFSENSYGFRPGRNQRQAVEAAREIVAAGKPYVVDIDLSKFFDRIGHDRLIARMGRVIPDKRILRLTGKILRSGILANGLVTPSTEGAVQGSPLSPLLSNIVLDELDKELERRGLAFCRFADDCNIFVKTPKAAERVMANVSGYIEKRLKLVVNRDKSQVARSDRVKFLGLTIVGKSIAISRQALQRAMDRVKELTPRGTHQSMEATIAEINKWYVGWSSYFAMTYYPAQLKKIEAHIRRRLRSRLVDQQKSRRNLYRKLVKRGVPRRQAAKAAYSHKARWALSNARAVNKAFPPGWFTGVMGQVIRSDQQLPHWFDVQQWIRLA
ncbi:MAG: group II intron reverse transcriptase/maturase [Gammaproteobacteria bacterium]|nr:group II intron reverse transcriptase/maturase [Gammaproteobacteria bacterium]